VFSINSYIKQLKLTKTKKATAKDVDGIIKFGKLDPYGSTPFQIKMLFVTILQGLGHLKQCRLKKSERLSD